MAIAGASRQRHRGARPLTLSEKRPSMPVRKIVSLMHVSLDGFVADLKAPPPGLDWMAYTPELEKYAHAFHERADVAVHGRVTYRLMESYWPTVLQNASAKGSTLKHARWLQKALKGADCRCSATQSAQHRAR